MLRKARDRRLLARYANANVETREQLGTICSYCGIPVQEVTGRH
jgi:hypothetical protein